MRVKVMHTNGVFLPLEQAKGVSPGRPYAVFSDEEVAEIRETLAWLEAVEKSFEFWNSPADTIFDTL